MTKAQMKKIPKLANGKPDMRSKAARALKQEAFARENRAVESEAQMDTAWQEPKIVTGYTGRKYTTHGAIPPVPSALETQVGGGHYKGKAIQPVQYIHANGLGFLEGCIVKRITRWRDTKGLEDLQKIKHEVDLLIELEGLV